MTDCWAALWTSAYDLGFAEGWRAHQAAADATLLLARLTLAAGALAWLGALGTLGIVARERRRWWTR